MENTSKQTDQRHAHLSQLKAMGYKLTVDEEEDYALVHTPGLTHSDFDSKSNFPNPWQIMKFVEATRHFAHHDPLDDSGRTFRDFDKMTSDRFTFMVAALFEFEPIMFDISSPKSPVAVTFKGGYIGNTSFGSVAKFSTEGGDQLFSNTIQCVSIDKSTRRPMPLPDWWKEKYAKHSEKCQSLKYEKQTSPTGIDPFKITVMRSEVDKFNHTNWSSYVKFASDAIAHFSKQGKFAHFDDFDRKGLKKMELLFAQESYDGDILDVYAWEQSDSKERINIHIYKNSNFLFQATFEYFEGYMDQKHRTVLSVY